MIPEKRLATTLAILTVTLATACGSGRATGPISVRETRAGDTTVYTSVGVPDTVTIDSVTTVWQSDSLAQPTSMALDGDRLVVGDRTNVHILTLNDGSPTRVVTVGRQGGGPGEYESIYAVGLFGPDTLGVYDSGARRLTWLSPEGDLLGSARVTPHAPYTHSALGHWLVSWRRGFFDLDKANIVGIGSPIEYALVWTDLTSDTSTVVQAWETPAFVKLGAQMIIGPQRMFGPNPTVALGPGPMLASGDGLEYCVTLTDLSGEAAPRRLCRDRARTPVGSAIRHPDLTALDDRQRRVAEAVLAHQEIPDLLPSYDRLRLGSPSKLWVRTMGPGVADMLPIIGAQRPDLGPKRRLWDVFDVREGRLLRTLSIPASFDPQIITQDRVYGFSTLPTGEIVIGAFNE